LSEYYYGLIDRGWPLSYKIFRLWDTEGGHCQNIIMGWWAGDGHCHLEYLGCGTQRVAIVRILLWAD
jgi:hypothetical protein